MITNKHTKITPRLAVLTMFFVNGALFANWVSRIPDIQFKLNLSEGQLGLVLLGIAVGVLAALSLAGGLVARFGSRKVTVAGGIAMCLLLPLLGWIPQAGGLWVGLFLFGAVMSLMDVAMNAQGVEVEHRHGRVLMSSFHAAFSIGGFVGAAMGAGLASLTVAPPLHFGLAAAGFLVLILVCGPALIPDSAHPPKQERQAVFQLPPRLLWPLGAVAFCSSVSEGGMADWSAVYLHNVVNVGAGTAALGFAAFSLTMTGGRLIGDWLTTRTSPAHLVRAGGAIATLGLLAAVWQPQLAPTLLGFAAVGAGLSIVVPLVFSAAGNVPGLPSGAGIAGVATIGYAGFLAGPPLIGLIAELSSLRIALLLLAFLTATLMFSGGALNRPQPATVEALPAHD